MEPTKPRVIALRLTDDQYTHLQYLADYHSTSMTGILRPPVLALVELGRNLISTHDSQDSA